MENHSIIQEIFSHLTPQLREEISKSAIQKEFPQGTEILREGQYVQVIPVVIDGLIKVFSAYEEKELLIYYIKPKESCIMSFAASLKNEPSRVYAVTEEDTTALLLPVEKVSAWIKQFPDINSLFYQQYNQRYSELLDTINHLLFSRMDHRLYEYLSKKVKLTERNPIKISHRQIANELGTAREVVSRVIKKLENEGKLVQNSNSIKIL
jgi:CRP/FNR family transcriptional regulator